MNKPQSRSLLMVSNGPGEDWIGAQLAKALLQEGVSVLPIPLVGPGDHYQQAGLTPLLGTPFFASGGFYRSWGAIWGDIQQGVISAIWRQRGVIRRETSRTVATIAVGDVACLGMATVNRPSFFLPTAKSDRIAPHTRIECALIKRWARGVFPRDEETAMSLRQRRVPAKYMGNIMMDGLVEHPLMPVFPDGRRVVILPGSRAESIPNLYRILDVLSMTRNLGMIIEVTPHGDLAGYKDCLKSHHLQPSGDWWICEQRGWKVGFSTDFPAATKGASVVVGLAGTANEQAAYLNRRVVSLQGTGPQTTHQRMTEQARLMPNITYLGNPNSVEMHHAVELALGSPTHALPPPQQVAQQVARHIMDELRCVY